MPRYIAPIIVVAAVALGATTIASVDAARFSADTPRKVYISAVDAKGASVADLKAADVSVKENGKPYPVASLEPATAPYQFLRLHIVGNGAPIVVGQLFVSAAAYVLDDTFVHPGADLELVGGRTAYATPAGVKLAYERSTPIATIGGILRTDAGNERELIEGFLATIRYGARPFVVVPRDDEPDAWMGWLTSDRVPTTPVGLGPHKYDHKLTIEMCARGMPHVDPDEV